MRRNGAFFFTVGPLFIYLGRKSKMMRDRLKRIEHQCNVSLHESPRTFVSIKQVFGVFDMYSCVYLRMWTRIVAPGQIDMADSGRVDLS